MLLEGIEKLDEVAAFCIVLDHPRVGRVFREGFFIDAAAGEESLRIQEVVQGGDRVVMEVWSRGVD
jgi:hypothetical protein